MSLARCSLALAIVLSSSNAFSAEEETPLRKITMRDAIQQALAHNPNVESATAEIHRAEALVRQSRSAWLPTLIGTGAYTRLDSDRVAAGVVLVPRDQLAANVLLTVPIISAQRWLATAHAGDNVDLQRVSVEDLKRQIALATGRAYLAIIAQQRVIEVTTRARETARAHFAFAHERLIGGVGNRLDEVRAEQEMATADSQVQSAIAGIVKAKEALGVLVGTETALDAAEEPSFGALPNQQEAMDSADSTRSDVRAQRRRVEATQRLVKDGWADYMPTLTGLAEPFYQQPPTSTVPHTGWQAQLVLSVPFYDGGLRYGLEDEREALATEARVTLDGTLRQARSDVRAAIESVKRADDAFAAAKHAADLSHTALDLATTAYHAGATTNLELIDAERFARDADTSAAVAEDASREARLELLIASGRFP